VTHVIDTPEGIAAYRALAIYHALKLEVNTGLSHSRGSVMKLAKQEFGLSGNRKADVLAQLEHVLKQEGILQNV
jgi:hypothetical protein